MSSHGVRCFFPPHYLRTKDCHIFFPFTLSMMKRAVESTLQRRNEAKKINTSSVKGENGKLLFFCWMQARAPVCCFFFHWMHLERRHFCEAASIVDVVFSIANARSCRHFLKRCCCFLLLLRALFIFVCRSYVDPEDRLSWQGRPFFYVRWIHQDEFFIKRFDQDFPWGPSKVCSYRLV